MRPPSRADARPASHIALSQRMPAKKNVKGMTLKAYRGDAKTLLAFNLPDKKSAKNLAGFTVSCKPSGMEAFYLQNSLQFERPGDHAQDPKEPSNSSINAPFHKFRWLHVPGTVHQDTTPFFGMYSYTVTPRYFDEHESLQPLDPAMSATIDVRVEPFRKNNLELGFTRGFTQSQAFTHHFGLKAKIRPAGNDLIFDTQQQAGTNAEGRAFSFEDEYRWSGFTAREKIFAVLQEVLDDKSLSLDVFAYDLGEPGMIARLLTLAKQGRVRVILDNAALHHDKTGSKPEDQFEAAFLKAKKGDAAIIRGHFKRYSHDKVLIVRRKTKALKVLTGSTNFSVTGLYVNSNHVLVFADAEVAGKYLEVFEQAWVGEVKAKAFLESALSTDTFESTSKNVPRTSITFAPHSDDTAAEILDAMTARISKESKKGKRVGSVLFAVMNLDTGSSPVYTKLNAIHADESIFSYGISDSKSGIVLFKPGRKSGVLVTGRPVRTQLPAPFDQVRNIAGEKHQVHHKFVVCGFNGDDPVVYCGSSNLATGGETSNGDNLLAIRDVDVATAFAIEALVLVDHFHFLNKTQSPAEATPKASKKQAALDAHFFLGTDGKWVDPYFDSGDLHFVDRMLFGS
ncbi:MAG: phospholipase D-like domain-containing protein [bacterium]